MDHQSYEELLILQALDALDASDQRKLEEHLETCAACRTELAELRSVAGLLAHASTPAEPSAAVRTLILDEVRKEKQSKVSSPVVPFRARPAANVWPNLLRLAAAIAFVALLTGMAVLWRRDVRSRQEIARLSQQFNQQNEELARNREALARQREAIAFMNAPGMKKMELAGTQAAQSARAMFVYDQNTGRAMVLTAGLPAAPAGMAYEVWFIPKGHSPMPGKTFTVDNAGHGMMMDQMPPEAMAGATIAITLEPKGGSASPTGAIYLSSAS
jgi:anti-sigma-K factor RskA